MHSSMAADGGRGVAPWPRGAADATRALAPEPTLAAEGLAKAAKGALGSWLDASTHPTESLFSRRCSSPRLLKEIPSATTYTCSRPRAISESPIATRLTLISTRARGGPELTGSGITGTLASTATTLPPPLTSATPPARPRRAAGASRTHMARTGPRASSQTNSRSPGPASSTRSPVRTPSSAAGMVTMARESSVATWKESSVGPVTCVSARSGTISPGSQGVNLLGSGSEAQGACAARTRTLERLCSQ
mmetsp:Transcript_23137/g.58726  ORF Transcript_23137/g.58726 Transcript_23137/m.58726 type:complete len:249 (-) Transcript_23137:800-1546(-)